MKIDDGDSWGINGGTENVQCTKCLRFITFRPFPPEAPGGNFHSHFPHPAHFPHPPYVQAPGPGRDEGCLGLPYVTFFPFFLRFPCCGSTEGITCHKKRCLRSGRGQSNPKASSGAVGSALEFAAVTVGKSTTLVRCRVPPDTRGGSICKGGGRNTWWKGGALEPSFLIPLPVPPPKPHPPPGESSRHHRPRCTPVVVLGEWRLGLEQ